MQITHSLTACTPGTLVLMLPLQNTQLNNEENSFSNEIKPGVRWFKDCFGSLMISARI